MRKPDFFIIGAPKCGTTALSDYLRGHPNVCFSWPKEPHFFCTDFSERFRMIGSIDDYVRNCFGQCRDASSILGEASVWYLYSTEAVPNILAFNDRAKFIVMLRNPIDLLRSLHAQMRYSVDEDEPDFARAWALQAERRTGRRIPETCREPKFLQYAEVGRLGEQLARVRRIVPQEQLKVVIFDDFAADPGAVYRDVLAFLGLRDDGRHSFPRINERKAYLIPALGRMAQRPPTWLAGLATAVKKTIGLRQLGAMQLLRLLNSKPLTEQPLDPAMRRLLARTFHDDVHELGAAVGRKLDHWVRVT